MKFFSIIILVQIMCVRKKLTGATTGCYLSECLQEETVL